MTFADDLESAADGETILACVIGDMGWGDYGLDERHEAAKKKQGLVLDWITARPLLDYEYDRGYGAPDCQAVYAWTLNSVLFVVQYDGSTGIYSVPRNPSAVMPEMPGG